MQYPHWQYYVSLVDDVDRLSRFVELSEDNYATHSVECTRLLLASASEVDVLAKVLCEGVSPGSAPHSIREYAAVLLPKYPGITAVEVAIARASLKFTPWAGWTPTESPSWWQSYNKVKHERHKYANAANLGNALNAIAALCVLVSYLHYDDFISNGLNIREPPIFLDRKYRAGGKLLFAMQIQLPDFPPLRIKV